MTAGSNARNMKKTEATARRGRPKTRDRQHILETAMNAYWREDPTEVSVNAICQFAEVAKPSLYREFGSEDGLTAAVLELYAGLVLAQMGALLMSEASFAAKLEGLIHFASEDPQMDAGCLFVKMRAVRSRLGERTQAKIADVEASALGLYARFLEEGRERSDWTGSVPIELAARYLHEQIGLALTQRAAGKSRGFVRELFTLALSVL